MEKIFIQNLNIKIKCHFFFKSLDRRDCEDIKHKSNVFALEIVVIII